MPSERAMMYRVWYSMIDRCHNEKSKNYRNYGARGIVVCKRWRASLDAFVADVGVRPPDMADGRAVYSIDRINNDGNYEPGNVRWATFLEQQRNKRPAKLTPDRLQEICGRNEHGETYISIAKRMGVDRALVRKVCLGKERVHSGVDPVSATGQVVNRRAKTITAGLVREMRDCYARGETFAQIVRHTGRSKTTVRTICLRMTWGHVP